MATTAVSLKAVQPTKEVPRRQLANLDSLRSFAVLVVLISHLVGMLEFRGVVNFELARLGHIGVLAFFVHTSLVLMFSLERLASKNRLVAFRFYVCRATRIYPLAILSVLTMLAFRVPDPYLTRVFAMPSKTLIAANLLLVQNIVGKTSIPGPLWSLPFEVQMYIVLPVCFYIATRRRSTLWLALSIAAASMLGFAVERYTGHSSLLGYVPCFLSGVLAYTLSSKLRAKAPSWLWPIILVFWFAAATAMKTSTATIQLWSSWFMCAALGISIYYFRDNANTNWNRITGHIAKYSYGIYLLHTPLIYLVFRVWNIRSNMIAAVVWLCLTYCASLAAFHALESPFIRLGKKWSERMIAPSVAREAPLLATGHSVGS